MAGNDPIALKQGQRTAAHLNAARAVTFAKAGAQYIDAHRSGWSAKSTQAWTSSFDQHVYPVIGALPVQEIDTSLVMRVIEPIWTTKTETASRVRGRIEAVMDWAATRGFRKGDNPARWDGHLENLLPAKPRSPRSSTSTRCRMRRCRSSWLGCAGMREWRLKPSSSQSSLRREAARHSRPIG